RLVPTREEYILAAHIQGTLPADATQTAGDEAEAAEPAEINVVVVSDIDVLYSAFFALRSRGSDPDAEVNLSLDNVTFILNVLDSLADDDRFIEIRKRRPEHRTLTRVEAETEGARTEADQKRQQFMDEFDKS